MAVFINPIEILQLADMDVELIDATILKKAKRQLFAEIDLADHGTLDYKGEALTRNACEAVIDRLDDPRFIAYFHFLANAPLINDFLATGNEAWLAAYQQAPIFADPGFIQFISPQLAPKVDKVLLSAFLREDGPQVQAVLKLQALLVSQDIDHAFRSLSRELQTRIEEVDRIKEVVKDDAQPFTAADADATTSKIVKWFPIGALQPLPTYFQSQVNKAAAAINYLQLAIWERLDQPKAPLALLEHILQMNIESADKPTFESNHEIIKKRHTQWVMEQENAPQLARWQELLATLKTKSRTIEAKIDKPADLVQELPTLVPVDALNALPAFADDVRTRIAQTLRATSIAAWNNNDDITSALAILRHALQLIVPQEVKKGFNSDLSDLEDLHAKYKGVITCYFCGTGTPDDDSQLGTTIYKETSRSWFPQRKVEFQYIEVKLKRCKNCKDVHEKGQEYMLFFAIGGGVLGALIGAVTEGEHFIIGTAIGLGLGLLGGWLQKRQRQSKANVIGTGNAAISKHPQIADYIRQGWSLHKPSA